MQWERWRDLEADRELGVWLQTTPHLGRTTNRNSRRTYPEARSPPSNPREFEWTLSTFRE